LVECRQARVGVRAVNPAYSSIIWLCLRARRVKPFARAADRPTVPGAQLLRQRRPRSM